MGKLAIKRLTGSDLTLFEWQFRNRNAGNQKSINLNANIFIDQLYPTLESTDPGRLGRLPIDLFLFGPGRARSLNLQRKIIKGSSYKNWRLNGEYIANPFDNATRFNSLEPNDYAIFDFEGELFPSSARVVFVARNEPDDAALHAGLADAGFGSMSAVDLANLRFVVHASGTPEAHPVYELLLDAAIEDAAQGGIDGTRRLLRRNTGRRMTRAELERARQKADDIGRGGEELIDGYFAAEQVAGRLSDYEWVSGDNAIAPNDFAITLPTGEKRKVEVKSTSADFSTVMHISIAELIEMHESTELYDVFRVYALDEHRGRLRVASDTRGFAATLLKQLAGLPEGVSVDSVSVRPEAMTFGPEIVIDLEDPSLDQGDEPEI